MYKIIVITLLAIFTSGCMNSEACFRSDDPLDRKTAVKELTDVPFPASAHSIYYMMYAGGMQDLEFYLRFDVDPEDLDQAVADLIDENNKQMSRTLAYPKKALAAHLPPTPRDEFQPMSWWTPEKITKGYYKGHTQSYALNLYVDEVNSRIYMYQSD